MQTNFEWQAPEYEWTERGNDWYWVLGVVGVIIIGLSIYFKNYLLGILVLLGGTLLFAFSKRKPSNHDFVISPEGFFVDGHTYSFSEFEGFTISEPPANQNYPRVTFYKNFSPTPYSTYLIDFAIDTDELREFLATKLEERENAPTSRVNALESYF